MPSYIKMLDATGDGELKDITALHDEYETLRKNYPQYWDKEGRLLHNELKDLNDFDSAEDLTTWLEAKLASYPDYEEMNLLQLTDLRLRQGQFLTLDQLTNWIREVNVAIAKKDREHPVRHFLRNEVLTFLAEQRRKGNLQVGEDEKGRITYRLMGNRK